ncbi:site-specific integrase [Enterococcus sp. BWB1-3]|uniref:tyrosine-type recombinase/integrase n=1 Tax=Enterococcus sp. BWB1-3 TaxID=2787713 RepID=UPI0019225B19|nr:site-specific integrase [Enterococcus sp. BWB1-3]MBL1229754.1 site-specific integrase [Enterococcus sp. BWB1-3]
MSRKGENIYKRKDGRWEGRYKKSRNKENRLIYGYIYGKRYSEVKEKLIKYQSEFIDSNKTIYSGTTSEWFTYWLHKVVKNRVKPSTWSSYESKIRNHIIPFLGRKKLNQLERTDVMALIEFLLSQGYSINMVKTILTILKNSLNYAAVNGHLNKYPYKNIVLPSIKRKGIRSLSVEEQKALEEAAFRNTYYSAVIISLATGMRIGEISGLRWEDIDFTREIISVNRTLQRIPDPDNQNTTMIIMGEPKTKSSLRKIPLAVNLKNYLVKLKKSSYSEYVVSCSEGFTEPRVINYHFKKLLKYTGIRNINFHCLRHTFATRCVENGADIASLSKILGHTSIKLTLDTYTDSFWEKRKEAMNLIDLEQFNRSK